MNCPSLTELSALNAETALADHLANCVRCQALCARLEPSEPKIDDLPNTPHGGGSTPTAGEVWTIWAPWVDEYLVAAVIESDAEEMLVLPLMPWEQWAADADIDIEPGVLGYRATAPLWAADHVLIEQAAEVVDMLSETWIETLRSSLDTFHPEGESRRR